MKAKKIIYTGLFIDKSEFYAKFPAKLAKEIEAPHVTVKFKPKGSEVYQSLLGEKARVEICGYGIDGENEGLKVRVMAQNAELQRICDEIAIPHITVSVSENGQPVNTAYLEYSEVEPVVIEMTYGIFTSGGLILGNN